MPEPLPLSVVIVAKNEAHNLPRCLGSVAGWTTETLVALNGTTDESEAVAQSFGATVHHLPWQGYRDTKNAALALGRSEWVLSLDADEWVSAELRRELGLLVHAAVRDHGLPSVSVSDVEITRDLDWATVWVTALVPEQGLPAVKALNQMGHELRHALARSGMRMRRVPELKFKYDDSVDKGERIERLLRERPDATRDDDADPA